MEKPLLNTEKYLSRIENADLEIPHEDLLASLERLNRPLKQVVYENEGRIDFPIGDITVEMTYGQLNGSEQDALQNDYLHRLSDTLSSEGANLSDPSQWRVVKEMYFSESKKHSLFEMMPEPHTIFFCPTAVEDDLTGSVCMDTKNIYILGDIVTPRAIATILHEIGHTWDKKNKDDPKVIDFDYQHVHASKAEKVRSERSATAWAIKKIKDVCSGELKSDIINFLKYYALKSYYDSVKNDLARDRDMARFWGPDPFNDGWLEEMEWVDDFNEFKKTDAYDKWRRDEGIEGLEEYEEYAKWREWIERDRYKETSSE